MKRRSQRSFAIALAQFAAAGVIAAVLLGAIGVAVLRNTGTDQAIDDAKRVTRIVAHGIVAPEVTDGLTRGDPHAVAQVDRAVRSRVLGDPIERVKIWTGDGRIVYSDEPRLIGSRYPLGADEMKVLRTGATEAEVSDLSRPENRFEPRGHKLLEVYLPIKTPSGKTLMFEAYQRFSSVAASGRRTWLAFLPALIGALLLFELIQLPLAARLARRVQRGQREREQLLERAIDASETERRRIAGDLHDGAVQSLAGVSYSLAAAAERAPEGEMRETLDRAAAATRESIRELRGLLVDIYPPSLHRTGLAAALRDAAAPLEHRGVGVKVEAPDRLELPDAVEALLYRVAQEALRNVAAHSEARQAEVRVVRDDGRVSLEVEDDGRGFAVSDNGGREGHFGLKLMHDLARDAGAELTVQSQPGEGTRVRVVAEAA